VWVDASQNLLAAFMARAGQQGVVTRYVGEAAPRLVICGAGILTMPMGRSLAEKLRQSGPNGQIMHLPAGFSNAEAAQAGADLLNQLRLLLTT
jgi:hypothetical protein